MFRWLRTMAALAISAALLVLPQVMDVELLFDGADYYTFYSQSVSSQAHIVVVSANDAQAVRRSLQSVTGESALYRRTQDAFAQVQRYGGELIFSQTTGDVTDYYYYAPRLQGGVLLEGERINLHVAVRGEGACIGSPLIFGGY